MNTTTTSPITQIDKTTAVQLRHAIDAALKTVAEEYGLKSLSIGNITMDPFGSYFKTQLTCEVKDELNPKAQERNKRDSEMLGYDRSIVGEWFLANGGRRFKVLNLDMNRPKYPIVAMCENDGKTYKFGAKNRIPFENKEIQYDGSKNLFQYS